MAAGWCRTQVLDGVARPTGDFQEDGGRSGLGIGKAGSGAPKAMSETQISEPQTSGSCPADNQIDKHITPGRHRVSPVSVRATSKDRGYPGDSDKFFPS